MRWEIDWNGMFIIAENDDDQDLLVALSERLVEQTDVFYDEGKLFVNRDSYGKINELDFHR